MDAKTINQFSIKNYLAEKGIHAAKERGYYGLYHTPFREDRNPSMKVDYGQNLWYDFGLGEGGSIIDLVAHLENCSIGEAIKRLEGEMLGNNARKIDSGKSSSSFHRNAPTPSLRPEPATSRIEIVLVGELKHPALVNYLRERGIDPAMARKYCHEVRYSIGGREYFAIGFRNDAGGWELRNRNFKGSSTPKNITTIHTGKTTGNHAPSHNASDTVMVFEGFIDFLSYLSLKQNSSSTIDTAVLNSVANLRRAIPFLESHRTIHAFLDNDDAGRKALGNMRELLPLSDVVDQSVFYRNHKDLNKYLTAKIADNIRRQRTSDAAIQRPIGAKIR